jgi:hypothetical protein
MQLALRRAYYDLGGLGQSGETETEGGGLPTAGFPEVGGGSGEGAPYIDPETGLPVQFGIVTNTDPLPTIIPYGTTGGQMTGKVPPLNASQLASAISAGTVVLAKSLTGAAGIAAAKCSSGYATPQGACVQIATTAAGIGTGGQVIPGVSNQTLAIGVGVLLLFMFMGERRR